MLPLIKMISLVSIQSSNFGCSFGKLNFHAIETITKELSPYKHLFSTRPWPDCSAQKKKKITENLYCVTYDTWRGQNTTQLVRSSVKLPWENKSSVTYPQDFSTPAVGGCSGNRRRGPKNSLARIKFTYLFRALHVPFSSSCGVWQGKKETYFPCHTIFIEREEGIWVFLLLRAQFQSAVSAVNTHIF